MRRSGLPPVVGTIENGEITWQRIENIDYETLGFVLACHLIIEHYVTETLKSESWPSEELRWEHARLTFSQKVSLLPENDRSRSSDKFADLIPCIKHLNSLRNKFSHNIDFHLSTKDMLPFSQLLTKISAAPDEIPSEPVELLSIFTTIACAYFGGFISRRATTRKPSRVAT